MFKSMMLAGSVALGAMALAPAAEAKTNVHIHFGVPFYTQQVGPGWRYYSGYGWYDYGRWGDIRQRHHRLSCGDARRLVDRSGYDRVRTVECNGRTFTFKAENRKGKRVTVYVNSRTGAIWR
jgi:hypothetical protein